MIYVPNLNFTILLNLKLKIARATHQGFKDFEHNWAEICNNVHNSLSSLHNKSSNINWIDSETITSNGGEKRTSWEWR